MSDPFVNVVQEAIDIGHQAVTADEAKQYDAALSLYQRSLEYFIAGLKYEADEKSKEAIRNKAEEYMARAEELREATKKKKHVPAADMANGTTKCGRTVSCKQISEIATGMPYEIDQEYLSMLVNEYNIEDVIRGDDPCASASRRDCCRSAKGTCSLGTKQAEQASGIDVLAKMLLLMNAQHLSNECAAGSSPETVSKPSEDRVGIVITKLDTETIIYASEAFSRITGYAKKEVLGRNCRFLQGENTDPATIEEVRCAIRERRGCQVGILNYRKDGLQFWNMLTITPLKDIYGKITSFAGVIFLLGIAPSPLTDRKFAGRRLLKRLLALSHCENDGQKEEEEEADLISDDSDESNEEEDDIGSMLTQWVPWSSRSSSLVYVAETSLPTCRGFYRMRAYRDKHIVGYEPVAMICGDVEGRSSVPVRVHDQCVTSEVFGSLKCDCKDQLEFSLDYIRDNAPGIVIYLQQEGRGIGLANKIAAYAMQERGYDTVDANRILGLPDDCRDYRSVRDILADLGVRSIQLLTNNPRKLRKLRLLGVNIVSRIPVILPLNRFSAGYIHAKALRMGHMMTMSDAQQR
uniref:Putative LOV domain-containing protein n=1 Tax=Gloeochaete wittrockiana TaxID=38269 RepID=A0A126X0P0_9EUKA|nr:putative LOV domain-containing protein [Gloeochaete wittrockiana]|mmetsp:Transcript_40862/g.66247  ORF Transcript_40862/g.66247 Transcript_40862/m.66247 type:complete len:578 (+) Transcript_40862:130-1863(+)|eukprot:CAMPEP_0184643746 /NCGR_PEP_ID=MMETSP0308-20130426/574_1 /TAXON_ID=38269 /ORGANISM="Gloeochaete witrockiana, Strain SAG 46.84" /LENGTH=577 /DNA_ID=CAMNT_0027071889 /DNA_START=130 /DNA_END=1863 /DNA_ORIENTATION=+